MNDGPPGSGIHTPEQRLNQPKSNLYRPAALRGAAGHGGLSPAPEHQEQTGRAAIGALTAALAGPDWQSGSWGLGIGKKFPAGLTILKWLVP